MEVEFALKKSRGELDEKKKSSVRFQLQNTVVKELWEAEDDETKAAVHQLVKDDGERKATAASEAKALPVPQTPQAYAQ